MLSRFAGLLVVCALLVACSNQPSSTQPSALAPTTQGSGTAESPIIVPQASKPIAMDASMDGWKAIPFLPAPVMKKAESSVKMAWRADGLYGIAAVKDKNISVDEENPWSGDCIEVWVDRDLSRAQLMGPASIQLAMCPVPTKPGVVTTRVVVGRSPATREAAAPDLTKTAFKATWQKTADGYTLEFFIPVDLMKPAVMDTGGKFGLNVVISNDGDPQESLFAEKATNQGYRNPSTWAVVKLVK